MQVLGERQASDLHLHHGIAGIEMPAHLVLQVFHRLAGCIPAAADIAEHLGGDPAGVVAVSEHPMQRLSGNLGDRIPDGDLDGADGDRALAVAAGFFPLHHDGEDLAGIEILLRLVEQGARIGPQNAGDEPCAHRGSAGITTGRVEGEANDRPAIAHDIGDHRDDRGGHLGKIETGIGDVRFERDRALADVDDTHLELSF